ncbi:MAG: metalloregulator ArsR/SmtB family transcription factor [Planctomycetota bacterium]
MDRTFAALADPTRRAILSRLAQDTGGRGVRVSELAAPFTGADSGQSGAMSLPAVSKHLRVLERAGLLKQEKDGRVRRCHLQPLPLADAQQWVARTRAFWSERLDALADYLEAPESTAPPSPAKRLPRSKPPRSSGMPKKPRKTS